MAEFNNRGNLDPTIRGLKSNTMTGRRSGTPDSPSSVQGNTSPVPNTGSPTITTSTSTTHHPSHSHHHSNHRSYQSRGRYRGDGSYYGSHSHIGSHHPTPYRGTTSPTNSPTFTKALVDFMMKQWSDFEASYKKSHSDMADNSSMSPAQSSPINSHINSPHRGQNPRFTHQNSTGNNWPSSGGNGRRFSDNGEHSNTGSLRRNHPRGGNAASNTFPNNASWQRGAFINRQNSPGNTLNRSTVQRHQKHPQRSILPVAEVAQKSIGDGSGESYLSGSLATNLESLTIKTTDTSPSQTEVVNGVLKNGPCQKKNAVDAMSAADQFFTPDPPSSPSSTSATLQAGAEIGASPRVTEFQRTPESSETVSQKANR